MRTLLICIWFLSAGALWAEPPDRACSTGKWGHAQCIRPAHFVYDTCTAMRVFADRHGLNRGFFARLIWQESRLDPNALSHANARGIAQFIPSTAKLRGLRDPFNPADALEHAAEYLAEMTRRYGNEGLAAVGYNGGERRAEGFMAGRGLADETFQYVPVITGVSAEQWRDSPPAKHDFRLSKTQDFHDACTEMAQNRKLTPFRTLPPEHRIKPWGVQVAFATSKKVARARAKTRTQSCRQLIKGDKLQLIYKRNRMPNRKGFQFVQVGRNSRQSAQQLCTQMRRLQCTCLVVKN